MEFEPTLKQSKSYWKNLTYFFGSEDFSLIFLGVAILIQFIFLGVRSDEPHKLHKGLIFLGL